MVKRVVVGAHYGLRDWLAQRLTALIMAVYAVLMGVVLLAAGPADHAAWKAMFAHQWVRLGTFLFLMSLIVHAWIGVRDILMDYIKPTGVRLACQVVVILVLIVCAAWSVQILWSA